MKQTIITMLALVLVAGSVAIAGDSGISDPTITITKFTTRANLRDVCQEDISSLDTAVKATIDVVDTVQDQVAYLTVVGADAASAGTGTATIQVKDAAGNDLDEQVLVRTWVGQADDFGADALTDYSVSTGVEKQEVTTNAEYMAISDTNGVVVMAIDAGGADSVWVWAAIGGRIAASGEVVLTAP